MIQFVARLLEYWLTPRFVVSFLQIVVEINNGSIWATEMRTQMLQLYEWKNDGYSLGYYQYPQRHVR